MVTTEENLGRYQDLDHSEDIDLTPRDSNILHAIQDEGLTVFAFDGLKRLLGVHQEMLSRVLDRLEDEGLLEKVSEGYRLTERGSHQVARPLSSTQPRIPIVQSLLPHDIDVQRIIAGLKGRWFGSLRWLGYSQNEDGLVLKWITEEDSIQIDAKFTENYLSIDAKVGEERDISQAVKASHQLMGHISQLYSGPRRGRNLLTPVSFFPDLSFA
jgi:DNA-binding PadR family transcriptional regulator